MAVRLVLNLIDSPRAVSLYRKSGRLTFMPSVRPAPKPYVYLELRRIKGIWRLQPIDTVLNIPSSAVLVEYETENADYYRQFSIPVEEVEREVREGRLELVRLNAIDIVTEWYADEPMTWYIIDLRTGKIKRGSALELDEENYYE